MSSQFHKLFIMTSVVTMLSGCAACLGGGDDDDPPRKDGGTTVTDGGGTGGDDGGGNNCGTGLTECGGECVDTTSDPRYCGGCLGACATGEVCTAGRCETPPDCREQPCTGFTYCELATGKCLPGCADTTQCGANEVCNVAAHSCDCDSTYHRCGGACVSDFETSSCGSNCNACPTDPNGYATCDGSSCGLSCDFGHHLCNGSCADNLSPQTCGSRCTPCPTVPNGQPSCDGTSCGIQCNTGYHLCNGQCVRDDSVNNCGSSCTACPTDPNGGATCDSTSCGIQCNANFHLCNGVCVSDFDTLTCGNACSACPTDPQGSPTCDGTSCGISCNVGYHLCNGVCVSDYSTSTCGSSCSACPETDINGYATCDGFSCSIACDVNYHMCNGVCVYNYDTANCGSSCSACPDTDPNGSATCDGVSCGMACNTNFHDCGGTCASDLDVATCGTSCTPCPTDPNGTASCNGIACSLTCNPTFHDCNGTCVGDTDATACGTACEVCDAPINGTAACTAGACSFTCDTSWPYCGGIMEDFEGGDLTGGYWDTANSDGTVTTTYVHGGTSAWHLGGGDVYLTSNMQDMSGCSQAAWSVWVKRGPDSPEVADTLALELWDGTAWVNIWTLPGAGATDPAYIQYHGTVTNAALLITDFQTRFVRTSNSATTDDFFIDDFIITCDSDTDGLPDGEELAFANPTDPTLADTDGDNLSDFDEVVNIGTDPTLVDTDGDTFNDDVDNCPLDANPAQTDTDGNGIGDACEWFVGTLFSENWETGTRSTTKWPLVSGSYQGVGTTTCRSGTGTCARGTYSYYMYAATSTSSGYVESQVLDASKCQGISYSIWVKRGPETPDTGENFFLSYWNGTTWVTQRTVAGAGITDSTFINYTGSTTDPLYLVSTFKIRLNFVGGSGTSFDHRYVDDIVLTCP